VGPPGINVQDWEVSHRESQITVSSRCPDTFGQIVCIYILYLMVNTEIDIKLIKNILK
jgi:hypothetical protein